MRPERALIWAVSVTAVLATLLIGGVHPWTQVALSALVLALSGVWLALRGRRGVKLAPFTWPALIAVGFTLVQLIPLPSGLVHLISPNAWELRSDAAAGVTPAFMPLTVDVPATLLACARGFACLGLLVTTAALARSLQRAHRALLPIAIAGALLFLLAVAQRIFGAQTILGYHVHTMPGSGFFGTLVSGNHAASLFALAALISAGLAVELEGGRRFLFGWCAALSTAGVLFTASRGGAVGLAVGGGALAAVTISRRAGKLQGVLAAFVLVAVTTGSALWLADGLRSRLVPHSAEEIWANPKTRGWRDGLALARHFAWTGVGRGAFEAPLAAYRERDEGVRLVYPENILVQLASEWGVPISAALIVLSLMAARRVRARLSKLEAGTVGAACGVVAVLVHELADFGLEMPGVAFPTVVALGVVVGRWQEKAEADHVKLVRVKPLLAAAGAFAWLVVVGGAAWAAGRTLDADSARVAALRGENSPAAQAALDAAIARHPASDYLELVAATDGIKRRDPAALRHLNRALALHPANWQGHHLAARTFAELGHPQQAALEYRLALEHGMAIHYDELYQVLHARVIDAVPRRSPDLLELAEWLARTGRAALADEACLRALDETTRPETVLRERLRIATLGGDRKVIAAAAAALTSARPDAPTYGAAAIALAHSGDATAAATAVTDGLTAHPDDSGLLLVGARLRYDRGDLTGARDLLKRSDDSSISLADRKAAAELLALIADKAGDVDAAVVARARARLIARKLAELSDLGASTAGAQVY